jgi:hypothetical protein
MTCVSYDFAVWTASWPDAEALAALVTADPVLSLAEADEADEGRLAVLRRTARGDVPAFDVSGPVAVEPGDVPVDVTARALGLRARVDVVVPAASSGGVRAAAQVCRRLADATGGVVVDRTRGQLTWPPEARRGYEPPDAETVDVVQVDWLLRASDVPADLPARWLDLALRLLPEARPVGFGPTGPTGHPGPFTGRLDRDGEEAFRRAWDAGTPRLGWSGTLPVLEGSVTAGGPVRTLTLTVLRDALHDPRWRDALLALLVAVAEAAGAFYGQAQVLRGWRWDARGAAPGDDGERADVLAPGGEWLGLPPEPVWCVWFGRPYDRLVQDALPAGETRPTGTGLLHVTPADPVDRREIAAASPPLTWWDRLALRLGLTRRTWLPAELSAVRGTGWSASERSGPLRAARVRPPGLALQDPDEGGEGAALSPAAAPADRGDATPPRP